MSDNSENIKVNNCGWPISPFRARLRNATPELVRRWWRVIRRIVGRSWLRLDRLVNPPKWPDNALGAIYLNLGCGDATHPSFINIDALVARHIHYVRPIDNLSVFADNTVDLVYASHCLEHFGYRHIDSVLGEWRRVLKPRGVLRLGVPDFDALLSVYHYASRDVEVIQPCLMGGQDYALNLHLTVFTRQSLTKKLLAVGFSEVRAWERGTSELTNIDDFTGLSIVVNGRSFPVSLNLEAVK